MTSRIVVKPSSARPVPRNLTVSATVGGGMICRLIPAALYQPLSLATIHGIQNPSATGHSWTIRTVVSFVASREAAVFLLTETATTERAATTTATTTPTRTFMSFLL